MIIRSKITYLSIRMIGYIDEYCVDAQHNFVYKYRATHREQISIKIIYDIGFELGCTLCIIIIIVFIIVYRTASAENYHDLCRHKFDFVL